MNQLPRRQATTKPNFLAPEGLNSSDLGENYYDSDHLLGKLWKAIELPPPLKPSAPPSGAQNIHARRGKGKGRKRRRNKKATVQPSPNSTDRPLHTKLFNKLSSVFEDLPEYTPLQLTPPPASAQQAAVRLATQFCADLSSLASTHSLELSHRSAGDTRLSEAEVFVGTILSTTSQPRLRRNTISDMRERSTALVKTITRGIKQAGRAESFGEDDSLEELSRWAEIAWACWLESEARRNEVGGGEYGAESFGWVAIGAILDVEEKITDFLDEELESGDEDE